MPEQLASSALRVDFTGMPWQQVRPGVRHKVYREGSRQLRLVEFDTSDGVADWCQVGHVGYVLAGGLNIDVNGSILQFAAGDGLFIRRDLSLSIGRSRSSRAPDF